MTPTRDPYWLRFLPASLRQRLAGRFNLHAIIHNSGWLMFDKLVRMLLGLLVGAWMARYLGPESFGELAYVLAYIAFFQAIANLGADGIIVRDIARDKRAAPQVLGTAFILRLGVGLVCWLAAVGGMVWVNGIENRAVALTALAGGALVFQAADTIDLWFQSQSQSRRTVVAKLLAYLISNGVKVGLILAQAPLLAFAAVMALDALLAATGLAVAYKSFPTAGRWQAVTDTAKAMLLESWPYMLSGVSIMIYMRIDQIMLKNMLGARELGIYAAAIPLSQVWYVIPMTLATSLGPYIAKKKLEGFSQYQNALLKTFRFFGVAAVIVSIGTALVASLIISFLYGEKYSEAVPVLAIHAFTNIFVFQGVAQSLWILNERLGIYATYKTIAGALFAIMANYLLIPIYGIAGAAISANISFAVSAVLSNIIIAPNILKMQFGINPKLNNEKDFY